VRLASSEGCRNQAYLWDGRVLGLQFHMEVTPASVRDLVRHCADEIVPARFIQQAGEISGSPERFTRLRAHLEPVLERIAAMVERRSGR
jgi:hypothetical protein